MISIDKLLPMPFHNSRRVDLVDEYHHPTQLEATLLDPVGTRGTESLAAKRQRFQNKGHPGRHWQGKEMHESSESPGISAKKRGQPRALDARVFQHVEGFRARTLRHVGKLPDAPGSHGAGAGCMPSIKRAQSKQLINARPRDPHLSRTFR